MLSPCSLCRTVWTMIERAAYAWIGREKKPSAAVLDPVTVALPLLPADIYKKLAQTFNSTDLAKLNEDMTRALNALGPGLEESLKQFEAFRANLRMSSVFGEGFRTKGEKK